MEKMIKAIFLVLVTVMIVAGGVEKADARKKKKIPKFPTFVGAVKCNGSCHDPYYQAWINSPHGKTFNLLKPGVREKAKKRVKLDPEKDYTTNPLCLRCHTTGYGQPGGFKPKGTKRKGKDISTRIDPMEPNKEQVGCEMCHSVAGGSQFRVVMKNTKGEFKKADTEKYGQRWDYANVCTRCHTHKRTPFQPKVHDKYKFNFEERVKKVHKIDKYWNEDNMDQELEKLEERKEETAVSEEKPLKIEDFIVKKGKLRFSRKS
ncbi:MAG: cytochrome C-554, partial [Nitrospinaceae bacterium]|nr:cytochrome C-554 [Nitrospinaceae bacterium]NIR57941.1 cytochrome C-554 [Nitrospinaceae bacterium]NIS88406.1 cytochrome C-554 [Nitrospinaceae bacterium]NIT85277.1 cytochrome C-554 [Nitrospinaceae bacterium]NIU47437.1 cytochrome C-554 [Nitrospinaceae bacterium]